jgi:TRAP-type mannitol/chloroaromatic compound transport system permease small subunit
MSEPDTVYLKWARRLDPIAVASGQIVAWLIIPMVLGLTYEVVARYLFNAPTLWAYDMTFMMYGSYFMLGAAFKSFMTDERFVTSPWMPLAWPFKGMMPLTGVLLLIQGVSEVLKSLHALTTGEWPVQAKPETATVIL